MPSHRIDGVPCTELQSCRTSLTFGSASCTLSSAVSLTIKSSTRTIAGSGTGSPTTFANLVASNSLASTPRCCGSFRELDHVKSGHRPAHRGVPAPRAPHSPYMLHLAVGMKAGSTIERFRIDRETSELQIPQPGKLSRRVHPHRQRDRHCDDAIVVRALSRGCGSVIAADERAAFFQQRPAVDQSGTFRQQRGKKSRSCAAATTSSYSTRLFPLAVKIAVAIGRMR